MFRTNVLCLAGVFIVLIQSALLAQATPTLGPVVDQRIEQINQLLKEQKAYDKAQAQAQELFDYLVAYNPARQTQAFVEAAFLQRLTTQLAATDPKVRDKAASILLQSPELARELVFGFTAHDKPTDVFNVLVRLHEAQGENISKYPALTAAMCLVHDQPLTRYINENTVSAGDVLKLFEYYWANEKKMLFGLTRMPTALLIWVVDSTTPVTEMQWALDKFAGDKAVGSRFFDIQYDHDHLQRGTPKKVTVKGFNLPNILKYGGVCADQAYFACEVGKSIGVPTAYVTGQSGTVGHAWVGFVQVQAGKGIWNFDEGRYPEYQGIRGVVEDPQTRQPISDSGVGLLAELIGTRAEDRYTAIALTDAAKRLAAMDAGSGVKAPFLAATDSGPTPPPVRSASPEDQLALLETGLRSCPGYAPAWYIVGDLARDKKITEGQIRIWAAMVQRLTGQKYPDFTMDILKPMIAAIPEVLEQNRLWESAFRLVQQRKDLAAEIRVAQGQLWETQGDSRKAGKCYEDVITRFVNAGPFALEALDRTAAMLRESGMSDKVIGLYESTWGRTEKPSGMAGVFMSQSNWYQIGKAYAVQLRAAGQTHKADEVEGQLGK